MFGHSIQMLHSLPMPPVFEVRSEVRGERLGADAAITDARGEALSAAPLVELSMLALVEAQRAAASSRRHRSCRMRLSRW